MNKKIIIGYQGAIGSNTEKIAQDYNEVHCKGQAELLPLINSENVMNALKSKEIDFGVFAHKNSISGMVRETAEVLKNNDYIILSEKEIPIHYSLYVRPEASKRDIKTIYGHRQALNQCKIYLRNSYNTISLKVVDDGARVAKELLDDYYDFTNAVICPKGTGEKFGLKLIKENIEDKEDNKTNFIIIKLK